MKGHYKASPYGEQSDHEKVLAAQGISQSAQETFLIVSMLLSWFSVTEDPTDLHVVDLSYLCTRKKVFHFQKIIYPLL